uniref:DUF7869 domain-containing protein n=1 Tax=Magallana gigas TaxID=29159 RepID=A0A8W8MK70_MAGGI
MFIVQDENGNRVSSKINQRDSETSGMRKVGFGHFDLMQYPHDANLNLTVLLETLCEFKDALGTELHLQTDSASDNKNKTVLGFLGLPVRLGIFEECYLHMLPVGHTHEDIDSMFSNFSSSLKGDIMTLDAFQKLSYVERGKMVKLVWDFKGWMENSLINSHGLGDQFEFRIHTVDKERRIPIFHYRKGEGERWMPDAVDNTTYEVHQDRCGILIFKDMDFLQRVPECVAPTDKSMYLDRILKERCPKLLKSGLLTSTEQQWWENFSSEVMTYLKTSRNVDFPLIHLIESVKEIPETLMSHPVETRLQELEDKAMKRALLFVVAIVKESGRKTLFNLENGPSDKWCRQFFKRHPDISEIVPEVLDKSRARMSSWTVMNQYFNLLNKTVEDLEEDLLKKKKN